MHKKSFRRLSILAASLPFAFAMALFAGCGADNSESASSEGSSYDGPTYSVSCLGDSITYGIGVSAQKYRYTKIIEEDDLVASVQNVGFSGSTVGLSPDDTSGLNYYSFTNRYTQITSGTDLIFVFGGTNDYGRSDYGVVPLGEHGDTDDSTFFGALEVLIEGLQESYPESTLLFGTPLPRYDIDMTEANTYGAALEDYRDAILQVCDAHSIETLDLFSVEEVSPDSEGHEDYFDDGLHPNDDGNALIARELLTKIYELFA